MNGCYSINDIDGTLHRKVINKEDFEVDINMFLAVNRTESEAQPTRPLLQNTFDC